jgi:hypothetical protein
MVPLTPTLHVLAGKGLNIFLQLLPIPLLLQYCLLSVSLPEPYGFQEILDKIYPNLF